MKHIRSNLERLARWVCVLAAGAMLGLGVLSCWIGVRGYVRVLPGWYAGVDAMGTQITLVVRRTPLQLSKSGWAAHVQAESGPWVRARLDWRWLPSILSARPAWGVTLPSWLPLAVGWVAWRLGRRCGAGNRAGCCPACGYDRSGLADSAPCPECGAAPTPP
ncbi:MAG: hypothetical protein JNL50_12510 [Phycisphaerae bacterium]|nr:hypothetical protein [Phycisphaerae bacterium]